MVRFGLDELDGFVDVVVTVVMKRGIVVWVLLDELIGAVLTNIRCCWLLINAWLVVVLVCCSLSANDVGSIMFRTALAGLLLAKTMFGNLVVGCCCVDGDDVDGEDDDGNADCVHRVIGFS
jgi:hypothetical protein